MGCKDDSGGLSILTTSKAQIDEIVISLQKKKNRKESDQRKNERLNLEDIRSLHLNHRVTG